MAGLQKLIDLQGRDPAQALLWANGGQRDLATTYQQHVTKLIDLNAAGVKRSGLPPAMPTTPASISSSARCCWPWR